MCFYFRCSRSVKLAPGRSSWRVEGTTRPFGMNHRFDCLERGECLGLQAYPAQVPRGPVVPGPLGDELFECGRVGVVVLAGADERVV